MPWREIRDYRHPGGWTSAADADARARELCAELERGGILYFTQAPFEFPVEDVEFLLSQPASDSRFHKNISYKPAKDALHGAAVEGEQRARLHGIMRHYSQRVRAFVGDFLRPYATQLWLDYASFRPLEEQGRPLPLHKRNDLLHVDSFPTRPVHGARILRVFTNINRTAPRVWLTGPAFPELAATYAEAAGVQRFANGGALGDRARRALRLTWHSQYDRFMLHFHDWLKENEEFQKLRHARSDFPPGATWMVFTDTVPHAVLSGQYCVEQTFIVPVEAMVTPEVAPVRVLERIAGRALA
jgi:hypothetical protein